MTPAGKGSVWSCKGVYTSLLVPDPGIPRPDSSQIFPRAEKRPSCGATKKSLLTGSMKEKKKIPVDSF